MLLYTELQKESERASEPLRKFKRRQRPPILQANTGAGNLGIPAAGASPFGFTDKALVADLLEFNPISVDAFTARWMKRHAMVSLAHIILGSYLSDRQYVVQGASPEVCAFHQAWIDELLPTYLEKAVLATWYGWMPIVVEWEELDGFMTVPSRAFDVDPYTTFPEIDERGDVIALEVEGTRYGPDQVTRMTWRQEQDNVFGEGQCISAKAWWKGHSLQLLWMMAYYQRSVDPQRMVWSKNIEYQDDDGSTVELSEILADAVDSLDGGETGGAPLEYDENGNPIARIDHFEFPDRSDTFIKGLAELGRNLFVASLVIPGIGVDSDGQTFATGRIAEKVQLAVLESIGQLPMRPFNGRAGLIAKAHEKCSLEGPVPKLVARPFKREQLETLKDIVKPILTQPTVYIDGDGKTDGRMFRGLDVIDVERALERMDIPTRPSKQVARVIADEPSPGAGGRPQNGLSERAEDRSSGLDR